MYPKDVGESGSTVATKGAEDEILAFLVKDQYSAEHGSCLCNLAELSGVKEVRRNCQHKDATELSNLSWQIYTYPSTPLRPPYAAKLQRPGGMEMTMLGA